MSRRGVLTGLAAVVGLLVGSGCGGDDDGDGRRATRDIQAAAQARAESLVLKRSDFTQGWRASPPEQEDEGAGEEFRRCVGVDFSEFTVTGEADSDEFSMGNSLRVSSDARVVDTERDAVDAVAEFTRGFHRRTTNDCLGRLIAEAIKESSDRNVEVGEVEVRQLSVAVPAVEQAQGWEIAIPIEVQGSSTTVLLEYTLLREGNEVVSVQAQDVGRRPTPALGDQVLGVLAARMSQAP